MVIILYTSQNYVVIMLGKGVRALNEIGPIIYYTYKERKPKSAGGLDRDVWYTCVCAFVIQERRYDDTFSACDGPNT